MHHLHNESIPVHKYYDLSIKGDQIPEHLRAKAFIAHCDSKQKVASNGGKWKDGYLTAKVRSLGDYCIMVDETRPMIEPISFRNDMTRRSRMTFKITDNMPTTGKARGLSYTATIDGKWVLMQYDEKNDLLIHELDERTLSGEHTLKITVRDDRGNKNVYQRQFRR